MAYIIDKNACVIHQGRNLRCLFTHAQRIRKRLNMPLFMVSDAIRLSEIESWQDRPYSVVVTFTNGDKGYSQFADPGIAGRFIKTWANKRGGLFHNKITGETNGEP